MAIQKKQIRRKKRISSRSKISAKFQLPKDQVIDYKDLNLISKFVNDRGKMIPRRITGVTANQQRQISTAIKRARFLALLTTGGIHK